MGFRTIFTWNPHQRQLRVIVKTLCYRLFMLLITIGVAFFITGNTGDALSIGLITNVTKTFTYYFYERVWDHIAWGVESESV